MKTVDKFAVLIVLFSILGIFSLTANAQGGDNIRFDHLTIKDGLAHNQTYSILQDRQGFIWIGTRYGLSKYDGSEFTNYANIKDDPNSLSENWIWHLLEDDAGMLWVSTWGGGLNKYDPATDSFTRFRHDKDDPNSLSNDNIWSTYQNTSGTLWVCTDNGLNRLHPEDGTFTRYNHDPDDSASLSHNSVTFVQEDSQGHLWVGTYGGGLNKFDPVGNTFIHYRHDPDNPNSLSNDNIWQMYMDGKGILWLSTDGGLNKFDPATETFTHYQHDPADPTTISSNTVTFVTEDLSGILWVSTFGGGLNRFDPNTGQASRHQADKTDFYSIRHNTVWGGSVDTTGVLWIPSEDGINIYDPGSHQFGVYRYYPHIPETSIYKGICGFHLDAQGNLWIGSDTYGLTKLSRDRNSFVSFQHDEDDPNSLIHNTVRGLQADDTGIFWIATRGGLDRFDPATDTFTHYQHEPDNANSLNNNNIVEVAIDGNGVLWLSVYGKGLDRFDPATDTFTHYPPDDDLPDSLSTAWITEIEVVSDGHVWAGGDDGLSRFDPDTGKFTNYHANDASNLSNGKIYTIYEDKEGTIWVGTGDGLNIYNPNTDTFTSYFTGDGLPSNQVVGIIDDDYGNVWISTNKGLSKFDRQKKTFRNYDARDGLQGDQFNHRAVYKSDDGELFFGGIEGFNTFYPDRLRDNPNIPRVVLTDFQLFNKSVGIGGDSPLKTHINLADTITLSYDQSVFSFEFAALNFRAPEKNQYAYKMEGFDDDWRFTTARRRFATYTNLNPGRYTFRVKASNNDGIWNEEGTAVNITILPPWWQTWWFRTLIVFLIIGSAVSGYYWRVHALEVRSRVLEQQVAERTQELAIAKEAAEVANQAKSTFLANMSHELRSPLNAILGFAQVMTRSRNLPAEHQENVGIISRSGEHLLSLINQVLDLSKIEAGRTTLNTKNFDLHRLLDDVHDMFALKADDKGLQLLFDRADDVPRYICTDELKLRQVIINLLNNALKFTKEGDIQLSVTSKQLSVPPEELDTDYWLLFTVKDTGSGIAPEEMGKLFEAFAQTETGRQAQEGTGLGLPISRKFAQLMGGELTVSSQVGQGTIFTFDIRAAVVGAIEVSEQVRHTARRVVALEPGQPRYRLLIVDDRSTNRQLLIKLLNPLGFDLREAENGQQAVEIWEAWQPHLIWMDMRMPVLDGYEATQRIKDHTKGQATAIIALTASALEEERSVVLSAGCDDFLRKPFKDNDIFDMLHKHLGVQFVYEEPEEVRTTTGTADALTPEHLRLLPEELLARFADALDRSDTEMIESIITEIRLQDTALAESLAQRADLFEYDAMLDVIREVRSHE